MSKTEDKEQLLRDPSIKPTGEVIAVGLGSAYEIYNKFIVELENNHGITLMDWRFYNDGKAWLSKGEYKWMTSRGTNKAKPIFWLSIWNGFFKVSFFFPSGLRDELLELPLTDETNDIIREANPMGKTMRFMPVVLDIEHDRQLNDIYTLAQFRKARVK